MFHKLVVAAFITFVIFDVFASMSFSVTKTIATALVSSRHDYYNSLYHNIALKYILKFQCVQNCLARVVTQSPRFSHTVPLLKSLHWLPVRNCIIFKICIITYQALSSKQPVHLHSLLTPARDSPDSFYLIILIYFSFPVLRRMSQLELLHLLH